MGIALGSGLPAGVTAFISQSDDVICGLDGGDTIDGRGNDIIYGGNGDDTIRGNEGADTIYPGPGTNSILGRSPEDTVS